MSYSTNSVTTSKAARLLGLAPHTVKKLYESGALRYVQVGDKKVVHVTEIERYQRYGAFDPSKLEEQTNAQANQKDKPKSQIKGSEIFRSDHQGATLPQEAGQEDGQAQKLALRPGRYALERAGEPSPEDPSIREVDRRADGRASRHADRLRDSGQQEANDPSRTKPPGESPNGGRVAQPSPDNGHQHTEGKVPLDEVEERFHRKVGEKP